VKKVGNRSAFADVVTKSRETFFCDEVYTYKYLSSELQVDGEDGPVTRSCLGDDTVLETRPQLVQQLQSVLAPSRPAPATSRLAVVRRCVGALVT